MADGEKKLVVEVSGVLLKRLKFRALQQDTTLKAIVETALNKFLEQKGGKVRILVKVISDSGERDHIPRQRALESGTLLRVIKLGQVCIRFPQ